MIRIARNSLPVVQLFTLCVLLWCSGCNVVKYLKPGEELYTGADVKVESKDRVDEKKIRKDLERILRPKPNQTIANIRFKLWFYYKGGEDPKKGFKKFLKYKVGEKPVFYNPGIPALVSDIMQNRLHNLGYFDARVSYSVTTEDQKTSIHYTTTVSRPYTINQVSFPQSTTALGAQIKSTEEGTLLKQGKQYTLDLLRTERQRIDKDLKNQGFYFFNPDYLLFKADSSKGDKQIDLLVTIKPDIPEKATVPYIIGDVYINASRMVRDTTRKRKADTVMVDNVHYISTDNLFKPNALIRAVFLRKGDRYSRDAHTLTLNRLMSMGTFHSANIKFNDTLFNGSGRLSTHLFLTPMPRRSLQLELQVVTKSNNFTGPALMVSYRNRNQFRSGELFVLNLHGNFESQFTGAAKGFNSYEFGANTQLFLPRLLAPINIANVSPSFVPRTKFDLGFRNLNRVLYYSMNAINLSYGYTWKQTKLIGHEIDPIAINFARVTSSTEEFDELLEHNPVLRRSFEQQFTLGMLYAFTFNSLGNEGQRNQHYYNGMIELSGNTVSFVQRLMTGKKPDPDQPFTVFGYTYSQFVKIAHDFRYHHTINKNSKIAQRIIAGVGFPYGNTLSMPYIKQFFSGGSNSIRAFLPRTVGPGVYVVPDSVVSSKFMDQAGDIKLEGNVEYRFTIISVLKGAVFLDAGNVWLVRKNDQMPGAEFNPTLFYKQLAVGSGFGLRLDVTYFVLRFDVGVALRKPALPYGERWVIQDIDLGDTHWRRQNLILNIAIGYPF